MIITIDGPAGSGKSTIARKLSEQLGFEYLRTGLMYRAVALAGLRQNVDWDAPEALVQIAKTISLKMDGPRIFLNGEDVSTEVETLRVTAVTRYSAGNPEIRELLTEMQREYARSKNCITEGRDQGTVAFPDAECKIYLDATPQERARRRFEQKKALGEPADYDEILAGIERRDFEDSTRPIAPLKPAPDAVRILSDGLSVDDVVEKIIEKVAEAGKNTAERSKRIS
ncbi:MAG: (d)CMP kinase [Thermoguttaceae bacterium]|nr:(d)CMP kinase [Thermoguttaceae bacterium]